MFGETGTLHAELLDKRLEENAYLDIRQEEALAIRAYRNL